MASILPIGITIARAATLGLLTFPFVWVRAIGTIIPNVTVREVHTDELVVTEHPVEQNAPISDHAYKRPATVIVEAGWSNSNIQSLGNPSYIREIYGQLIDLQYSRQPFDVVTGKRTYKNMMMIRLSVVTDEKTENVLLASAECREIIRVSTQTVTVPSSDVQKDPGSTAATKNDGGKQLVPGVGFKAS